MTTLKVGKLDNDTLKEIIIDKISYKDPAVLVKAGVGEDCAYLDYGDNDCVISTDPITASVKDIGKLAIHVACNDVASCGVRPFAVFLALMLPVGSTLEDVETIMGQAASEAEALKVEIAGGHTEVTPVVNSPVIVATALGKVAKGTNPARRGVKPGDKIIITKAVGLEGSSIIAADYEEDLKDVLTEEELAEAKSYADMTDVITEGVIAGSVGVSAMHDVTEGGVLGALWEMCTVAGLGASIVEECLPVEDVTLKICEKFDIDYRKLISSGAMMIIVPEDKAEELIEKLEEAGVEATDIGQIEEKEKGITIEKDGEIYEVEAPGSDELYKVVGADK